MDWLKSVFRWIQLSPRFLVGLAICCMLLVFLPDSVSRLVGIDEFRESARGWLFIVGAVSLVFSGVQLAPRVSQSARRRLGVRRTLKRLDTLSQEELELLAYCLVRNRQTLVLSMGSQAGNVATGLSQKGLLDVGTGLQHVLAVPHSITDCVWKKLSQDRDAILARAQGNRSDDEIRSLFDRLDYLVSGKDGSLPSTRWGSGSLWG